MPSKLNWGAYVSSFFGQRLRETLFALLSAGCPEAQDLALLFADPTMERLSPGRSTELVNSLIAMLKGSRDARIHESAVVHLAIFLSRYFGEKSIRTDQVDQALTSSLETDRAFTAETRALITVVQERRLNGTFDLTRAVSPQERAAHNWLVNIGLGGTISAKGNKV